MHNRQVLWTLSERYRVSFNEDYSTCLKRQEIGTIVATLTRFREGYKKKT